MSIRRRILVVAGVVAASSAAGATAGVLVAASSLLTGLSHVNPAWLWETVKLGCQTGAAFGVLLGPPITFGLLRRIPIGRLASETFASIVYGGLIGSVASLAFAQPRPTVPLMLAGSCIGFGFAALRLWAKARNSTYSTQGLRERASP